MSDNPMIVELKKRVDEILAPHLRIYGEDAPVVKIGREILEAAEATVADLARRKLTTTEAAAVTGYNPETLARHARAVAAGKETDPAWQGLEVERLRDGWLFVASTIPPKKANAA